MPLGLQTFYSDSIQYHLEEALIDAISKIVKINRNGVQSLANDIEHLAGSNLAELGTLPRVQKYVELLKHVDQDDSLFSLIAEDTTLKFKFSQIERLLIQRLKLQIQDGGQAEDQASQASASTGSSLYSYFGFNSSNAA